MSVRKTRLRAISPNDKLIIDDETGLVVGIAPDARTPSSRLMVMGDDLTLSATMRAELVNAGLLVADENGNFTASIGHRTGVFADLITISGEPGEISIPTDVDGFIVHNGQPGEAKFYPRLDNAAAFGESSLAIGLNATTMASADLALALGVNAKAHAKGELAFGSLKPGVRRSHLTGYGITTSETGKYIGPVEGSNFFDLPPYGGIYRVKATFVAREGGGMSENMAMYERACVVLVTNEDEVLYPAVLNMVNVADYNANLAGVTVSILGASGPAMAARVTGITGRTINWAVFVDVCAMTEEVLV